jgi:hypothetical protein
MNKIIDTDYDGMGNQGRLPSSWNEMNKKKDKKSKISKIIAFLKKIKTK